MCNLRENLVQLCEEVDHRLPFTLSHVENEVLGYIIHCEC